MSEAHVQTLREMIKTLPRGEKKRLAERAGVTRATLNNIERATVCGDASAIKVARAMGFPERWGELKVFPSAIRALHSSSSLSA